MFSNNYIIMSELSAAKDFLIDNSQNLDNLIYKITLGLFLFGISTTGFGTFFAGISFPTNISTLCIYLIFIVQLLTNSFRFSKFLFFFWLYIFVQTFILNWFYINFQASLKHFIGLILFSLVSFSFFSKNRFKIDLIIKVYYKYCFFLSCLAIFQFFLFAIVGFSFLPQNIISGTMAFQGNNAFKAEILGVFPRAVGLSTEPAHYVAILLPSTYLSIYNLTGNNVLLDKGSKSMSFVILFAFIISFSLVGYVGLSLCLFTIFRKNIKIGAAKMSLLLIGFILLLFFISKTPIGEKVYSFMAVSKDITGAEYTSSDQSSFALLSNLLVAGESLKRSSYMGTGLDSHMVTYDSTMSIFFSESQIVAELNKEDAGSMFIRIVSEFGIPGLIIFFWVLFRLKIKKGISPPETSLINTMCLIFLLTYCFRNGGYLNILFFFFFAMYYYTYILSVKKLIPLKYNSNE